MKTFKELINSAIKTSEYSLTYNPEDLKEFAKDILQAHENELAEKDKYIETLKEMLSEKDKELDILVEHNERLLKKKTPKLYKEDFEIVKHDKDYCENWGHNCYCPEIEYTYLKDNSKYDKLPSKEEE